MMVLLANSYDQAAEFNRRAFEHLRDTQGCHGGGWSDIFSDGSEHGIYYSGEIAPAFTEAELGKPGDDGLPANVVEVERAETAGKIPGKTALAAWAPVREERADV